MKSTIRPATREDLDALFAFVVDYKDRYPRLHLNADRGYAMLNAILGSGRHYKMLVEVEGKIAGALLAVSTDHLWADGMGCQVLFWVSRVPGDGHALLRRFRKWVIGRRSTISVAGFSPDLVMDARVWQLVERVGFEKRGGSYLHYN